MYITMYDFVIFVVSSMKQNLTEMLHNINRAWKNSIHYRYILKMNDISSGCKN